MMSVSERCSDANEARSNVALNMFADERSLASQWSAKLTEEALTAPDCKIHDVCH